MRIEIDGSPVERPSYASDLPASQYLEYLVNAPTHRKHGWTGIWQGGVVSGVNGNLLDRLASDPDFYRYVGSVIRHGQDYEGVQLASELADSLAESGEVLELVCRSGIKAFGSGLVKGWEQRYRGNLDVATPRLGTFLRQGALVFRGNVGEVSALRGGTVYVDGDVNRITQCQEGIVYINGDVNLITESDKAIVVVAGRVKQYTQYQRSHGGLNREVTPSPFIFTSHSLETEVPDAWQGRDVSLPEAVTADISPSYVVSEDELRGWLPEETKGKALELCAERIGAYLDDLRRIAAGITDASTMARFAKYNMFGFIEGNVSGYYKGSHDATPASAYD